MGIGKEREKNSRTGLWLSAVKLGGDEGKSWESKWACGRCLGSEVIQAEPRPPTHLGAVNGSCSSSSRVDKDQQRPFPF